MADSTGGTSDLQLSDTFTLDGDGSASETRPQVVLPPKPSWAAHQVAKFSNVVFSSATVALLRVFSAPPGPTPPGPPGADTQLPSWYTEEFQKKARYRMMMRQYLRDTALLTAAAYLMDGVETTMLTLRGGKDDALNKTLGGVAAGGMMGYAWFPGRPHARAILTSTGALVGYVSHVLDRTSKTVLLDQQQKLEKELLGVPDDQIKKELDTAYIRQLIKMKQKQMADAAEVARKQGLPTGVPGGKPWERQQSAASSAVPSPEAVPDWVKQSSGVQQPDNTSSTSSLTSDDVWADASSSAGDQYPPGVAARAAGVPQQRRSFWGWGRGQGQGQGQAGSRTPGEMEIREESDEQVAANEVRETVQGSLVYSDDELPQPRR